MRHRSLPSGGCRSSRGSCPSIRTKVLHGDRGGRDPGGAGHPRDDGLRVDGGHAAGDRALHAHPAHHLLRHPRLVAPPRGRRRLGDRGRALRGHRGHGCRRGLDRVGRPGRSDRADGRRHPHPCHGLLRLGFLANFLSRAVLIGFLTGVGIQVAMGQLAGVLGVSDGSGRRSRSSSRPSRTSRRRTSGTSAISIGVWVLILGSERINRRIPGALIAVVLMIVLGYLGVYPSTVSLLGDRACGPATAGPATGRHRLDEPRPAPAHRAVLLHHHPGPECRHVARLRRQVRGQLQRERRPRRALVANLGAG